MHKFVVNVVKRVPGRNGQGIEQIVLHYIIPPNIYSVTLLVKEVQNK